MWSDRKDGYHKPLPILKVPTRSAERQTPPPKPAPESARAESATEQWESEPLRWRFASVVASRLSSGPASRRDGQSGHRPSHRSAVRAFDIPRCLRVNEHLRIRATVWESHRSRHKQAAREE